MSLLLFQARSDLTRRVESQVIQELFAHITMFTLRCTQKLLRRGLAETAGEQAPPTTLLGDWYANVLVARPQHLVLCISERTLLPLVVPAKDIQRLPLRLKQALGPVLIALGIEAPAVARELAAMQSPRIGCTASKRVLGSLNELMFLLQGQLEWQPTLSLLEHSLRLSQTPMKGVEHSFPDRATTALFSSAAVLERVMSRSTL
jgi:hypothetical protein